jgi:hypothetical protein
MDYGHVQSVFSDLLLRRSMNVAYLDKRGLPSSLRYIETPTDSDGRPLRTHVSYGPPPVESPVVGVGISGEDGEEKIVLLTDKPANFDAVKFAASIGFEGVEIEQLHAGRANATSRPAEGGESLGHSNGDTGTFGCIVKDASGMQYLLSCNHVIAAMNGGKKGIDPVWQPGQKNGGNAKSRIGVLHDFAYITTGCASGNHIDAALCKADNPGDASPSVKAIGNLTGVQPAALGMSVRKSGANTGVTSGKVRMKNLSIIVDYPGGVQALFDGQLGIIATGSGNFSSQGDSGSIVVDDQIRAVGLVISALSGVDLTIANPISDVLTHFKVSVL